MKKIIILLLFVLLMVFLLQVNSADTTASMLQSTHTGLFFQQPSMML